MERRSEYRTKIARLVGTMERPSTGLTKPTLNSLHAYLTGEFVTQPSEVYAEGPSKERIKELVAAECDLEDYIERAGDMVHHGLGDRDFRIDELKDIQREMDDRGDQRDWSG